MPAPASAARAEPARPPAPEALLRQYAGWLAARGRGNRCFADSAAAFLRRWPDTQSFAAEPLEVMLAQDQQTRPFITFLLLHDLLRPGYDYLAERKFASLLELARGTRLEPDLDGFQRAAAELGFSPHVCSRSAERVIIRLLIQSGRSLHDLTASDLRDAEAAFRTRGERRNGDWSNDRGFLHAAWAVLFHLGISEVTPPNRRRRGHAGHAHHFGGVPAWLAARLEDYTSAISGTREASTMDGIAIRLAHFGRHLASVDPGLDSLAGLDRQRHIETYLAATAVATALRGGQPIGAGEQRNRIITLGRFLADITGWKWPDAPARRLVFTRDIPKVPLGKLASERMVPLDDDAVALIDRIAQTRSPGRPMTHPKTGRPAEFLLTHFGKRVSAQALRDELARACQAGLPKATPHQLRHSWATALINAGCSLQALMVMLGHTSAAMSLRYARLFDSTVRADYERALAQAKTTLTVPPPGGQAMLPVTDITGRNADWKDTPLIKSRLAGGYCLRTAAQGSCAYANICEHCPSGEQGGGQLVKRDRLVWVGTPTTRLDLGKPLPLVVYPTPSMTRTEIRRALDQARLPYRTACVCRGVNGLIGAVAAGIGISAMAASLVPAQLATLGAGHRLPELGTIDLMLLTNPRTDQRPAVRALIATVLASGSRSLTAFRDDPAAREDHRR